MQKIKIKITTISEQKNKKKHDMTNVIYCHLERYPMYDLMILKDVIN